MFLRNINGWDFLGVKVDFVLGVGDGRVIYWRLGGFGMLFFFELEKE